MFINTAAFFEIYHEKNKMWVSSIATYGKQTIFCENFKITIHSMSSSTLVYDKKNLLLI